MGPIVLFETSRVSRMANIIFKKIPEQFQNISITFKEHMDGQDEII